ncbi:hypothetical protein LCGC14_0513590 [marine sediment metagenome]|uniref:Uncharacterized protein n=1 Tax=marine sediment metagenome TaxID=412755 RepID=A0A0F9SIT7_9ZZZZ
MMAKRYYCEKHRREGDARWGGDLHRAYPGDEIITDASRCEHLHCVRAKVCPTCGRTTSGQESGR